MSGCVPRCIAVALMCLLDSSAACCGSRAQTTSRKGFLPSVKGQDIVSEKDKLPLFSTICAVDACIVSAQSAVSTFVSSVLCFVLWLRLCTSRLRVLQEGDSPSRDVDNRILHLAHAPRFSLLIVNLHIWIVSCDLITLRLCST